MTGKRILLAVSGGIAAYKSVYLLRELQKAGAEVRVVMTPSATRFVGLETFAALTRQPVPVEVFNEDNEDVDSAWSRHIHWAEWADAMIVVPCTANTLAKIVHGLSDNMLTTTALAIRCPLILCPTMDGGMYRSPANKRNLELAASLGYHIIEPDSGYLASGLHDEGRLPEIDVIIKHITLVMDGNSGKVTQPETPSLPLKNKKVVVTAGPTREYIDTVRFISNPSSGKMGIAMAEAAKKLGAEVVLIHGKLSTSLPSDLKCIPIVSAADLFEAVKKENTDADVVIMSAAVSDFTPVEFHDRKIKKSAAATSIELKPTTDILAWLGKNKRDGQTLIGFAMETENLENEVKRKLTSKKSDWIIGNLLNQVEGGFESDTNQVLVQGKDDRFLTAGSKKDIALEILKRIFGSLK
jgi:phosphopantothenoylcysteine decarboxylase / phosphopantothenate---cysteine ligase